MREGWEVRRLGDVCEVINGGTPKTTVPEYWDGTELWITPAEMGKRPTPYVESTERMISLDGLRNSSARMLPPLSVILSTRAPIGHLIINTKPMATNQGCKGLVPGKHLWYKYLYQYLSSIVELLDSLGTGATFRELSGGKLKEVPIPLPPLAEQRRIVAILDEAFAALATAQANAERNLQNARALFESRLNEVFTQRGEGWVEKKLGEVCDILDSRRKPITKRDREPGEYPYYGATGIVDFVANYIFDEPLVLVGEDGAKWGPCEKTAFIVHGRCWVNNHAHVVRPDRRTIIDSWLVYFLNYSDLSSFISGLTVPKLTQGSLREIPIPVASLPDQRRLATHLDALSAETQRLASIYERKLAAIAELKKSLLHQAFAGEL